MFTPNRTSTGQIVIDQKLHDELATVGQDLPLTIAEARYLAENGSGEAYPHLAEEAEEWLIYNDPNDPEFIAPDSDDDYTIEDLRAADRVKIASR